MHGKRSKLAQKIIHHLCTILTCVVRAGMMHNSFTCRKNVKYVLFTTDRLLFVPCVSGEADTIEGNVKHATKQCVGVVLVHTLVVVPENRVC